MPIRQMINTREPGALREFQQRMIVFGRIRTGVFETPPGKRGRPAKLDRFRFTSLDQGMIGALADQYGGTVEEYVPQGNGKRGWQVTTDADTIPVYIVNRQKIDPTYECWAGGGRCIRRCDGVYDAARDAPCVCNGLHPDEDPPSPRDMCKMTTRVNVMLPEIEGVGSWLYESHGENFAIENGGVLAQFVASADRPVPAHFRLEPEVRQHRRPDGTFERREFYVARFWITALTPGQIALGGDVVTKILEGAGSPAALAAPMSAVPAIEAAPATVAGGPRPPESAPAAASGAAEPSGVSAGLRAKILADIEAQTDMDGLTAIRAKLTTKGITDQAVKDAWNSKKAAITARDAATAEAEAAQDAYADREPHDDSEPYPRWNAVDEGVEPPFRDPTDEPGWRPTEFDDAGPEYKVGDTVTVGGIEFTKISDSPFPPGSEAAAMFGGQPVEGTVEDGGGALPMPPAGDYTLAGEMAQMMTIAGQRTPPLKTNDVTALIMKALGLPNVTAVGATDPYQLARVRLAMQQGAL